VFAQDPHYNVVHSVLPGLEITGAGYQKTDFQSQAEVDSYPY